MDLEFGRLAPEIVLLAGAMTVLLGGSFRPGSRLLTPVAIAVLGATAALALLQAGRPTTVFSGTFALDGVTTAIRVIVPLATVAVLLLGSRERRASPRASEVVALLLLATLGALVVAGADDLLVLAAGFLLSGIPLVGLTGIGRGPMAAEAALKRYVQGAVAGVGLLGGGALLVAAGGTSTYSGLTAALPDAAPALVAVGAVLVAVALLFEVGAVPLHFWVPDVAQGASRQVAAFATTVPKLAALVALLRLDGAVRGAVDLPLVVAVVAALTMGLGTFAAFRQEDVRRLLGWSTVAQAGFLLVPIAAGSVSALLVAATGYAVANLAAFAVVSALPGRRTVRDWRGAARAHPFLTGVLLVALLAFVGTPPTSVFLGKLAAFQAAWAAGLGWLVAVGAAASVASLFYALRWIGACFRRDGSPTSRADTPAAATALVLGAVVLGFTALLPALLHR